MRKVLALAVALFAFSSVAQAQSPPTDTYPNTDLTAGAVLDGTVFPYLGNDYTTNDFAPYYAPAGTFLAASYAAGPGGMSNTGTYFGVGGTTILSVMQATSGGNLVPSSAVINVTMVPSATLGPIAGAVGYVAVMVVPMDPFHPAPPYTTWFPVGHSLLSGPTLAFSWSTALLVPPHSVVVVSYCGTAFGATSVGICPGVAAEQFIF